jgi:purine-binding chemotaxis protein CheW
LRDAVASASTGSSKTGSSKTRVCTFWLGKRRFGVDVALVGEVVVIESFVPVPLAPDAVLGIMNLRGMPVAIVDFAVLLGDGTEHDDDPKVALVLKSDDLIVGLAVDGLDSVVSSDSAPIRSDADDEHPLVAGFLELDDDARVVTLLEARALIEKLGSMRYLQAHDEQRHD